MNLTICLLVVAHLHPEGPDPAGGRGLPRPHRRGLRPDVRPRQGRAARPRRPDRARRRSRRRFDDEVGYRISRVQFELPEISLEADEAAIVGLAARVWQHASLASATTQGLRKLRAGGVAVDESALTIIEPAARHRRAGLRRACSTPSPQRRRSASSYQSSGVAASHRRGTSSRGGSCPGTATGTSSATTATATPSGCSGSRGSWATSSPIGEPGELPAAGRPRPARAGRVAGAAAPAQLGHRPGPHRRRATSCAAGPSSRDPVDEQWTEIELPYAQWLSRWPTSCCRTAPTWS